MDFFGYVALIGVIIKLHYSQKKLELQHILRNEISVTPNLGLRYTIRAPSKKGVKFQKIFFHLILTILGIMKKSTLINFNVTMLSMLEPSVTPIFI